MVNETDQRRSICLTCDQSSHCLISQFLSGYYFQEMLEYFFPQCQEADVYFCTFSVMQISISLSATEFKVIGILQKTGTHYGTVEGTITVFNVEGMF